MSVLLNAVKDVTLGFGHASSNLGQGLSTAPNIMFPHTAFM